MFLTILSACLILLLNVSECLPSSFLLATNEGAIIHTQGNVSSTNIFSLNVTAVDYRYSKRDIYFISNNEIFYSYFSQYFGAYSEPLTVVKSHHPLTDLVVDWVAHRVYVSCSQAGAIYEVPVSGASLALKTQVENVRDLAIDPYERRLFFIFNDNLGSVDLQSGFRHVYFTADAITVVKMAVDHHERMVYVVRRDKHDHWNLVATDYAGAEDKIMFTGEQLRGIRALTVFNSRIVWCHSDSCFQYTPVKCDLTSCDRFQPTQLLHLEEVIHSVRFYNPLVQTPSIELACSLLNCSHNCSVISLYRVACTCPIGSMVYSSENMCQEIKPGCNVMPQGTDDVVYFERLKEALFRWLVDLMKHIRTIILICSLLMLMLLLSGICILQRMRSERNSRRRNDSYDLAGISNYALNKRLDI